MLFKLRCKTHYNLHIAEDVKNHRLNPAVYHTFQEEAFLGKLKNIAIRCHGKTCAKRVFERYLLCTAIFLVKNQLLRTVPTLHAESCVGGAGLDEGTIAHRADKKLAGLRRPSILRRHSCGECRKLGGNWFCGGTSSRSTCLFVVLPSSAIRMPSAKKKSWLSLQWETKK